MREPYVNLCGVSEQEIHDNLEEELHELAELQNMTYEDVCIKLKEYYDGYHFVENTIGIYNPSACSTHLNIISSATIGSKQAHRLIWLNC